MSTVPEPFGLVGKCPAYLNMPGGQWRQDDKYISGEIQENHELNLSKKGKLDFNRILLPVRYNRLPIT